MKKGEIYKGEEIDREADDLKVGLIVKKRASN